jgi:hypothetical protein
VRVLVAVGDRRDPADLGPVPSTVRVERWVPQAAVMRTAAEIRALPPVDAAADALAALVDDQRAA